MSPYYSRDNHKGWMVHRDDTTLKSYGTVLVDLLAFTIRSLDNSEEEYKLPLNEKQVELGHILFQALQRKEKDIQVIHRLFYTFMAPPTDDQPFKKWNDTLQCFLAITNVRVNGTFAPAEKLTADLARWEYNMHGADLYESVNEASSFGTVVE